MLRCEAQPCSTRFHSANPLLPPALQTRCVHPSLLTRCSQFDGDMEARLREAEEHGEVLRYVGSYDAESGVCQVGAVLASCIGFLVAPARLPAGLCGCWCGLSVKRTGFGKQLQLRSSCGCSPMLFACALAQAVHVLNALLLAGAGAAVCDDLCALPPPPACLSLHNLCPAPACRRWCGGSPRATPLPTCRAPKTSSPSPRCGTGAYCCCCTGLGGIWLWLGGGRMHAAVQVCPDATVVGLRPGTCGGTGAGLRSSAPHAAAQVCPAAAAAAGLCAGLPSSAVLSHSRSQTR